MQIDFYSFYSWVLKIAVRYFLNKQSKKSEAPSNLCDMLFYRLAGENGASEHLVKKAHPPQQRAQFEECLEHK